MSNIGFTTRLKDVFEIECYDENGKLLWRNSVKNLVVNAGLDDLLDKYFKGSGYTAAHYIGLTDGTPSFAADDTMASHAGWSEMTIYSETTRPQAVWGAVSGQSVDNSANKAVYHITGSGTIGGLFLCTDNTKGGTSPTLYGGGAFTNGDKPVADGYTLHVQATASASAG